MKIEVSLFLLMSIVMPIRPIWAQPNCGGGNVGNGICADSSLCCSQWGYCGSSASHCADPPVAPNNNNDGDGPCSSLRRCGYGWEDANTKCGAPCTLWQDPACAAGENCYGNLSTNLECCQEEDADDVPLDPTPRPSTTHLRSSAPTAGTTRPVAPPVEPPVASPVHQPPLGVGSCSVSRCGATWIDANTKCGLACSSWDDPICSSGENCYDGLSTSLACCDDAPNDEDVPSNPDDLVVGTCGSGSVGNGICSEPSLCCSQWGWCGSSTGHCGDDPTPLPTLQPPSPIQTPPPTQTAPTPTINVSSPSNSMDSEAEHSRLIAYVGNWQACPTRDQWEHYTHIVIAFAVSYTWSPGKNQCNTACDIAAPPVCNNAPNPELIQEWKDAGKKVLLSFGGAGMGGSWSSDVNDCWEHCFGKEDHVVNQLVSIVNNMNLDGVDLDYEYYYEDNQNNSGFTKGADAQHFLSSVTTGLRRELPSDSIVTHAPMDSDLLPETDYYHILKNQAHELDFLMPQYYNGVTRPGSDFAGVLNYYTDLAEDIFQGDPTKIVFGFCISDCGGTGSNLNGAQSALVMTQLQSTYPCNGGAFFWVAQHDVGGAWSASVSAAIGQNVCQE